jgi:hypothetical protein
MLAAWAATWWWWLAAVCSSWFILEMDSIYVAHITGARHLVDYTLSDAIRRWSGKYRWLSPVVIGTTAFLLAHFFLIGNP